ncbi:MAG: glycosyltransferase family 2 protein [Acidimicrobiia bacterium]
MSPQPSVSVIVPARNAESTIAAAIDSIIAQDYAGSIQIVVADGSTDAAPRLALAGYGNRIELVDNPSGRTPDALNAAIAASSGEVIVRCDAHAALPPDYVRRAVDTLATTGAANVGGIQDAVGSTPWERAVAVAQSTPLGVGDARYRLGGEAGPVDTVYLGVFDRSWLERVGGFDPQFLRNQDYELNWRIREAGWVVWFDPALKVSYRPRSGIGALARQYFEYGQWKRRMLALHPGSLRFRQTAAPLLVVGLAASLILAMFSPVLGSALPAAYLLALLITAVGATVRRREPAALLAIVAIPVMHLPWGVGFLLGQRHRSS